MTSAPLIAATLRLTRALEDAGYAYVIGGALALAYWANPRATRDVDMTIDVVRLPKLIGVLTRAGCSVDSERVIRAAERGDFGFHIDGFRVDVFLPTTAHTEESVTRRLSVPFASDHAYVERWLAELFDPTDSRVVRFGQIQAAFR